MENKLLWVLLAGSDFGCICFPVECVVGGHTSMSGVAPYVVSVQNPTHICGGVLVANNWVLTTASCVQGRSNLKVLVGSLRLLTNMERTGVQSVTPHSAYNSVTGVNNVALLRLSQSVVSNRIIAAQLNSAQVTSGLPTAFYGWGSLNHGSATKSNELQTLYQKTLSTADCAKRYQNNGGLATGFICAQIQPGQAACSKDEGGPLIDMSSGKLLGIYDHGIQCSGVFPDVFIDVATHKTWIDTTAVN
ncbi:chymotrypsin-2-like [Sabethes cyaneus]|uniref:chymotrypsin-2-like n=1 Tax=Sabethes cyaneus TaxID=53552 RepID=UPI00237E9E1B|nr:chymotrypsin-2-like [Sabethes cyaneus]